MVYWEVVQRSHGVYDVVQHGSVYSLSVVAHDGMPDNYARDVAEQARYVIITCTHLPLKDRFAEAQKHIQSRYDLWKLMRESARR